MVCFTPLSPLRHCWGMPALIAQENGKFRWRTGIQTERARYCFVYPQSSQTVPIHGWCLDRASGNMRNTFHMTMWYGMSLWQHVLACYVQNLIVLACLEGYGGPPVGKIAQLNNKIGNRLPISCCIIVSRWYLPWCSWFELLMVALVSLLHQHVWTGLGFETHQDSGDGSLNLEENLGLHDRLVSSVDGCACRWFFNVQGTLTSSSLVLVKVNCVQCACMNACYPLAFPQDEKNRFCQKVVVARASMNSSSLQF